jgi:hypothetical protein
MQVGPTLARAALAACVLVLVAAPSGCVGCGGEPESRDADVLRLRFPEQAKQVLDGSETFVPIAEGFAIDLPATAEIPAGHRGLTVHLPKNGSEPVRFALPGDFSVQVRESGMLG